MGTQIEFYATASHTIIILTKLYICSSQKHLTKMRTLKISISDLEYRKFGIPNDQLSFTDLIDLVSKELSRETLNNSVQLAERLGLSKLTIDDITNEVKAVRKNAKDNN